MTLAIGCLNDRELTAPTPLHAGSDKAHIMVQMSLGNDWSWGAGQGAAATIEARTGSMNSMAVRSLV
jgi:hypothetical protein